MNKSRSWNIAVPLSYLPEIVFNYIRQEVIGWVKAGERVAEVLPMIPFTIWHSYGTLIIIIIISVDYEKGTIQESKAMQKLYEPCLFTTILPSLSAFVSASRKFSMCCSGEMAWYMISALAASWFSPEMVQMRSYRWLLIPVWKSSWELCWETDHTAQS